MGVTPRSFGFYASLFLRKLLPPVPRGTFLGGYHFFPLQSSCASLRIRDMRDSDLLGILQWT